MLGVVLRRIARQIGVGMVVLRLFVGTIVAHHVLELHRMEYLADRHEHLFGGDGIHFFFAIETYVVMMVEENEVVLLTVPSL